MGVFAPPRPSKMQQAETAGPPSMKRRANALTRDASLSPIVLGSSSPVAEEYETPVSTPKKINSTKTRVRECENKLAHHINLIHAQDFKTTAHEDSIAEHAKKIKDLGSRLKVVEKGSLQGGEKFEAIQQSVAEVTERLNSRGSSIRKEVKTQFNQVQHTITHEQNHANARLDRFSNSLAVQKVRLEDCQKAVNEQGNKIKDKKEGLKSIEKSLGKKARKLSARIDVLEERFTGAHIETNNDEDVTIIYDNPLTGSRPKVPWANLAKRVTKLEEIVTAQAGRQKSQASTIERLLFRMEALETSSESSRTALETRVAAQGDRLVQQERATDQNKDQVAQLWACHHRQHRLAEYNPGQSPGNGPRNGPR